MEMRQPTGAITYSISRMDLQLTGKVALVTGSTAGIGYAIAAALAREGAAVIINGRTPGAVDAALAKLEAAAARARICRRFEHRRGGAVCSTPISGR
jgi:NAD(P)-dependent dehydrogenase (short-subunit alcohol dehydrogenase family)